MTTTKWSLDPMHSEIQFKVKHLMISTVTGGFNKFTGTVETDGDDFTTAKVQFVADINSINTNNEHRDQHLKNADFFEIEKYPSLEFSGKSMEKIDDENYKLHGELTLKGVTKALSLDVEFGGITQDPWGNTRSGFSVNGKINRKDFGMEFNAVGETGGLLLGEEIKLMANAEFVKELAIVEA